MNIRRKKKRPDSMNTHGLIIIYKLNESEIGKKNISSYKHIILINYKDHEKSNYKLRNSDKIRRRKKRNTR